MAAAWARSGIDTRARSWFEGSAPGPDISRLSWAMIWARTRRGGAAARGVAYRHARGQGRARRGGRRGRGSGSRGSSKESSGSGSGGAAAALPGSRTMVWHLGHLTANGLSGTFASSMTIRCAHWGHWACTVYLSIRSSRPSDSGLGAGRRAAGAAGAAPRAAAFGASTLSIPLWVSSRSCRFVRLVA